MRCRECGSEGSGNYCAQCGAPLQAAEERRCGECGAEVDADARYCTECGEPVAGGGGDKPWTAYLPWALSALALVAFAVAITLFLQTQTSPRQAGSPPTGSLPGEDAAASAGGAGGGTGGGSMGGGASGGSMPSAGELANMPPRQAADRLFDRAMRVRASGDTSRAAFFARMGRKAYARVPASEMDPDARFHVGMLALVQGDMAGARSRAEEILSGDSDHLLGLILALRSAGDGAQREEYRQRFLEAAGSADLSGRPAYEAHRTLIENLQEELAG